MNGTTYVLGTDGGYREFNYGGDGSSAGNDSAEESAVIGVDYYLEFIDLVKGVTVLQTEAPTTLDERLTEAPTPATRPVFPLTLIESVSVVNKMDFMSINGGASL